MTATNSKENFSELLSSLCDGSPMWKLALSQIPAEVLEKEDENLLMRAFDLFFGPHKHQTITMSGTLWQCSTWFFVLLRGHSWRGYIPSWPVLVIRSLSGLLPGTRCLSNPLQFSHRFLESSALPQLIRCLFCSVVEVMIFYVLQICISIVSNYLSSSSTAITGIWRI